MWRTVKGFTMMELMVVMAIMGGLMALVGPSLMNSYQKMQVESETRKLKQVLKKISYKAFLAGQAVTVKLNDSSSIYFYNTSPDNAYRQQYQHLYFPPQELAISVNGFIDVNHIEYIVDEQPQQLPLQDINSL